MKLELFPSSSKRREYFSSKLVNNMIPINYSFTGITLNKTINIMPYFLLLKTTLDILGV